MTAISRLIAFLLLIIKGWSLYCVPYCNTNTGCTGTYAGCTGSCKTPYTLNGSGTGCSISAAQSLYVSQLPSDSAFSISGFSSNTILGTQSCNDGNTYHMMGPFGTDIYLYKQYNGLGTNHYQLNVFWSYGVFGGTWTGQALSATFKDSDGIQTALANQGQTCASTTALSGCTANTGCFNNYKQTVTHNSDFLSVNFSSISSAITASQSWGLSNLYIVLSLCESTCQTCTGPNHDQCLSCIPYLFLQGSVCILTCPFFTMVDTRECVSSCPAYYFGNSYNNYCEQCPSGCLTCINYNDCVTWTQNQDPQNTMLDLLPLWITLLILFMALLALLVWKLCFGRKHFNEVMEEEVIDHRKKNQNKSQIRRRPRVQESNVNVSNQTMQARWVDDIDSLHNTKLGMRKVKNVIEGIGK